MEGVLRGSFEMTIYYEDTDALGMVYHANYLKFFDRGRVNLIGIPALRELVRIGVSFVVSEVSMKFRSPACLGDLLRIDTELTYSRSPRMLAVQRVSRGESLLAEGTIELAAVDLVGRPVRLPSALLEDFQQRK